MNVNPNKKKKKKNKEKKNDWKKLFVWGKKKYMKSI